MTAPTAPEPAVDGRAAVRLLIDAPFPPAVAGRLRALGRDALSVRDPECAGLEGAPDADVWAAAADAGRALVTENACDYSRIEAAALARGGPVVQLILTGPRDFPRGAVGTIDRLVTALAAIAGPPPNATAGATNATAGATNAAPGATNATPRPGVSRFS